MKKLIACLTLAAFVAAPAALAGEKKSSETSCAEKTSACCAEKSACSSKASKAARAEMKGATLLLAKK